MIKSNSLGLELSRTSASFKDIYRYILFHQPSAVYSEFNDKDKLIYIYIEDRSFTPKSRMTKVLLGKEHESNI